MGRVGPLALKRLIASGMKVEVGEPFRISGERGYMCLAKVVGHKPPRPPDTQPELFSEDEEATQTLCIVSEEGRTPEEARSRLMTRLSEASAARSVLPPSRPRTGWLERLIAVFREEK